MWNTFSNGSYHYQRLFFFFAKKSLVGLLKLCFLYKSSNTVQEISGFDAGITVGMVTPYVEKLHKKPQP